MDARLRLTFFCGSCLGLAMGFAVGHVSVWQRAAALDHVRVSFNDPLDLNYSASLGAGGMELPVVVPTPGHNLLHRIPSPGGALVLNDPDLGDEPVHADALVEMPDVASPPRETPMVAPQPLTVSQAKPLPQHSSKPIEPLLAPSNTQQTQAVSSESSNTQPKAELHPEVVILLKDELQGVSEQQREVWADVLQGMNPADAAGVIMMLKKSGQNGPAPLELSSPPTFDSSHPEPTPTPLDLPTNSSAPLLKSPSATAVDLGTRIALHNQANRETCGYLEMIPVLKEVAFDQSETSEHVEIVGYRLDIEPGRLVETGNPSHVSVQRSCFFAVKLPTGEEQYTRVGRLVLDTERRLCIDLGDRDLPIAPEVKLPEGATRFTVQSGQLMVAVVGQAEPVSVGPLQVAEFFDASRLLPVGASVYSATTASGTPKLVPAELILETLEYPAIETPSRMAGR